MDQASRLRMIMGDQKRDFLSGGALPRDVMDSAAPQGPVRVISVTSGKGGVGKTNVVGNLAYAMSRMGRRVLILDADLGLANMDVLLGVNPRYTIQHVLSGEKNLEEVILRTPSGFSLLPAASGIQELTELDHSQRLLLLNEFEDFEDSFDVFLIDTGAGISSNVMYFNFAAMEKIVVVTNEPASLTDAYALIKILTKKYRQKRYRILVNAARSAGEAERIYRHLSRVVDRYLSSPSLDYLGWVPYDEHVPKAVRRQQTVSELYPDSRVSRSFAEIAERMLESEDAFDFEGDIKFFWRRLLRF
ncbi:MAG: MinD/ParA family protein [Deltaproteobacteria bacterium]|nr:MinD/ParA family protein [Deltaproteobacteria bacterium]MBW1922736.1 MinD/ParA family protein [Deltaproteobacteria bacterium]MBW2347138.1 MinD/ParA family protein [Deltaproteobacteria bacterium]RLB39234.1 MAG: flagellar synthesis regulator FleN [Deltaproteobacteria bacterium]